MYTMTNFKTKKQLKEAVAAGKKERIYQPGGMFNSPESERRETAFFARSLCRV